MNFRFLLEQGATYGYSQERVPELKWWISVDMWRMGRIHSSEVISQRCEYYCLQLFYLYFYKGNHRFGSYVDEMLQAIWDSISEPYITEDDIFACFSHMANNGGYEFWRLSTSSSISISDYAEKVHLWYCNAISKSEKQVRSPRCLQHLSRCAIRSHLRFPINYDFIDLPQKLKDYLMLKEL
nr:uncharacterized protein LOC107454856 [Parasteatoda tepidariorum]